MKVIVIGGVAAGMAAASKLKRNMKDQVEITVFEKGGAVSYGACGLPFFISGRIKDEKELVVRTPGEFEKSGIAVKTWHQVISVNPLKKTVTVKSLKEEKVWEETYDKLIVGSGAAVRTFPPMDGHYENLMKIRDLEDAKAIRAMAEKEDILSVLVVGAGFIGMEAAEALIKLGKKVIVAELSPEILPAFDQEVSESLKREAQRNEVEILVSTKVERFKEVQGRIVEAVLTKDGETRNCSVDLVINCAGIAPETGFLEGAEKAGNGALVVNERMETSLSDIYAGGDCTVMRSAVTGEALYAPLGTNANKQGRIIADVIAGIRPKPFKPLGSCAIRLFNMDAAKVGISEREAKTAGLSYKTNTITGNSYASYYGPEKLAIKVIYDRETRKILGAEAFGQGIVVPRANYFAVAISAGLTVDDMGFMDLCYSPPFSGVWDAALIAANTAK